MSLSTSSFRTEWFALLAVVLALLLGEGAIRVVEDSLSQDLRHIRSIPDLAQAVDSAPEFTILVMGNSLVREGIDEVALVEGLAARGIKPTRVVRVYPDASSLQEWPYVYERFFAKPGHVPDLLVFCLGHNKFYDSGRPQLTRIAGYYTDPRDVPRIVARDLSGVGSRAEFLLAFSSAVFRNHDRVRARVLTAIVPSYLAFATRLNDTELSPAWIQEDGPLPENPTYDRLGRLADLAGKANVPVVAVAMPRRPPLVNRIDPRSLIELDRLGITLIDLRQVDGLTESAFRDRGHLTAPGGEFFSGKLGESLSREIRRLNPGRFPEAETD